jgi:hypothetical protein
MEEDAEKIVGREVLVKTGLELVLEEEVTPP